jgi:hypothetical protein
MYIHYSPLPREGQLCGAEVRSDDEQTLHLLTVVDGRLEVLGSRQAEVGDDAEERGVHTDGHHAQIVVLRCALHQAVGALGSLAATGGGAGLADTLVQP